MKRLILVASLLMCCCGAGYAGRARLEVYVNGKIKDVQEGDGVDIQYVQHWQKTLGDDLNDPNKNVNVRCNALNDGYIVTFEVHAR